MTTGVPIDKVGIVAKMGSREAAQTAAELAEWLRRRDVAVAVDEVLRRAGSSEGSEVFDPAQPYGLVVVLGGDGTLLSVARSLAHEVPILGVNLGGLGFLTEINRGELYASLVRVLTGSFDVEHRAMLDVHLRRAGGGMAKYRIFNDAVITKGALARIIELSISVDGHLAARYRSDGLILSSPTGSTAYNLSAGGPIVYPGLPVAVLTPICAHALTLRPLVVPDSSRIEIALGTQREEVYLTLDGQEGTSLSFGDTVSVTRSEGRVRLVKISGRTFYDSLRAKLKWGGLTETAGPPKPSQ